MIDKAIDLALDHLVNPVCGGRIVSSDECKLGKSCF